MRYAHISNLFQWLETKVVNWLELLYGSNSQDPTHPDTLSDSMCAHKERLTHYMYEIYGLTHVGQLFNIIIDYPESIPALEDLRSCLEKTSLRKHLVQSLREALETRLLHPGIVSIDYNYAHIKS